MVSNSFSRVYNTHNIKCVLLKNVDRDMECRVSCLIYAFTTMGSKWNLKWCDDVFRLFFSIDLHFRLHSFIKIDRLPIHIYSNTFFIILYDFDHS